MTTKSPSSSVVHVILPGGETTLFASDLVQKTGKSPHKALRNMRCGLQLDINTFQNCFNVFIVREVVENREKVSGNIISTVPQEVMPV